MIRHGIQSRYLVPRPGLSMNFIRTLRAERKIKVQRHIIVNLYVFSMSKSDKKYHPQKGMKHIF